MYGLRLILEKFWNHWKSLWNFELLYNFFVSSSSLSMYFLGSILSFTEEWPSWNGNMEALIFSICLIFHAFQGIDFKNLRSTRAEFIPRVEHAEDTSNFEAVEVLHFLFLLCSLFLSHFLGTQNWIHILFLFRSMSHLSKPWVSVLLTTRRSTSSRSDTSSTPMARVVLAFDRHRNVLRSRHFSRVVEHVMRL